MELQRAIAQISEIHAHLLRSELFRGYRAVPVTITSGLALVAAAIHATLLRPDAVSHALVLWLGYAAVSGVICGADLVANCCARGRLFRQQAALALIQFAPAVVAGVAITAVLGRHPEHRPLLPGLWTILYALAMFGSLPYLPRALAGVAAFYLAAGSWQLYASFEAPVPSAWGMGLTYGVGQAAVAVVLHLHREREGDGR